VPEYQMTAPVWIAHSADGVRRRTRGLRVLDGRRGGAGRDEKLGLDLPAKFRLKPIGPQQTLARMIAEGEIDALHNRAHALDLRDAAEAVKRLSRLRRSRKSVFPQEPGIFPIMHTVVIRRELYRANRWIAQSLYKALRAGAAQDLRKPGHPPCADHHAPVAGGACRGARRSSARTGGPIGLEPQPSRARNFPALPSRAGALQAQLEAEEALRSETLATFRV